MSKLDPAFASVWQLARHWQQSEAAKLEMSCETGSLNIQLNAKAGHPDHLHFNHPFVPSFKIKIPSQLPREERRRHAARLNVEETKSTQN